jgi:hypothetical protein
MRTWTHIVVKNPHFEKSADREDSDDDEEEEEDDEDDVKSTVEKAWRRQEGPSSNPLKLMRKYRLEITIVGSILV